MADTYKGATGSSDEIDKVYYKRLRGEKLTPQEWKIWRESIEAGTAGAPETYETAPF